MIEFRWHHAGFVTSDVPLFERFWCGVLGFVREADRVHEAAKFTRLFGIRTGGRMIRYCKDACIIEIHSFDRGIADTPDFGYDRYGLNHICLAVDSKEEFLKRLPPDVERTTYLDPGGWTNLLVRDYEGNWVEIREEKK